MTTRPAPTGVIRRAARHAVVVLTGGALLALTAAPAGAAVAPAPWTPRSGSCPQGISLAFLGAQTGPDVALPLAESRGFQLAIDQFNARNGAKCRVTGVVLDTQGDRAVAAAVAGRVVADPKIVGVVGPAFSGESTTAVPVLDAAGVPTIGGGTLPSLTTRGWETFHRFLGNDTIQGSAAARYLADDLRAQKVAVFDDGGEYGRAVADIVRRDLGSTVTVSGTIASPAEVPAAVARLGGFGPRDAVYYGGYSSVAVPLVTQMRAAGITSTFLAGDGVNDELFASTPAAAGALTTCLCEPLDAMPRGEVFATQFSRAYPGQDPLAGYAPAAYDATNFLLSAIARGRVTRPAIERYLDRKHWKGVTRRMEYDANGDLPDSVVYLNTITNGRIVPTDALP